MAAIDTCECGHPPVEHDKGGGCNFDVGAAHQCDGYKRRPDYFTSHNVAFQNSVVVRRGKGIVATYYWEDEIQQEGLARDLADRHAAMLNQRTTIKGNL